MKFYEIVNKLQEENKGYIVLIRNGIFFCGIGKDAVTLSELLEYKPICFKSEICKCGIPVNGIKVGIKLLQETGYSFVIFDYNKEEKKAIEITRVNGKVIEETKENIECEKCWYYEKRAKKQKECNEELKKYIGELIKDGK